MANIWRARWMSLVASTAFQSNPAIQSRAFSVMGCLAREDVDDDLLYQVLVALRNALARFLESGDHEMLTSIVTSLTKMMENLSPSSRYLLQLFWLAISLVRVGSGLVFNCSAALLESTLRTIAASGEFKNNRMIPVLLQGRLPVDEATSAIDELYGLHFNHESFHIAVAATLSKGLQDPSTKPSALRTLATFLEVVAANAMENARWGPDMPIPPYLGMVLSRATTITEMKDILWIVGVALDGDETVETECYNKMGPLIDDMDEQCLLLNGVLSVIDFRTCEESIQKLTLGLFAILAKRRPEVLLLLYDHLLDHLEDVLNMSHNPLLLKEASILMCLTSADPKFANRRNSKEVLAGLLDRCGLSGMWFSTSFKATKDLEKRCAGLTDKLIEVGLLSLPHAPVYGS